MYYGNYTSISMINCYLIFKYVHVQYLTGYIAKMACCQPMTIV